MCFLPPNCIFCTHYNHGHTGSDRDCTAFKEIPEEILFGGNRHTQAYPGDDGVTFNLNPEYMDEYAEIRELRTSILEERCSSRPL